MGEILRLVAGICAAKGFSHDSQTRAMSTLPLWSMVAAMLWFAGTAHAQDLRGEALVKALQKGGYVLVMRHASSPREVPPKQTANTDNSKPERGQAVGLLGIRSVGNTPRFLKRLNVEKPQRT